MKLLVFLFVLAAPVFATPSLLLAAKGRALAPILISDKASDQTKAVAAELASYFKQISGATIEVRTDDESAGLVLGTVEDFGLFKDALATR
ncbi:MAG: hypothetical protein JNG86_17310, partial [Verrucomicrobiaceae bacterium]|nr:hypothetical protein [Verrucomicrobiaceae bacterium]